MKGQPGNSPNVNYITTHCTPIVYANAGTELYRDSLNPGGLSYPCSFLMGTSQCLQD